jgi:hypothetical protein
MAEGRRGFLTGLLLGLVPLATAQGASPTQELLLPTQFGPPPYRDRPRRRRRCWIERERVIVRDRFGRPRRRIVEREVCR